MREEAVYAYRFEGKRYDCGSKLGYLQATVAYALDHPQLGKPFRAHLLELAGQLRRQRPKPKRPVKVARKVGRQRKSAG